MKRTLIKTASALLFAVALSACTKTDVYNAERLPNKNNKPSNEYFDFNTTAKLTVDLNYGALGAKTLIQLYKEDPFVTTAQNVVELKGTPLFQIFTDKEGRYQGEVEIPTSCKTIHVVAPYSWGVSSHLLGKVENGRMVIDASRNAATIRAAKVAERDLQLVTIDASKKVYSIVDMANGLGKLQDINSLVSDGNITANFVSQLKKTLWNGQLTKPNNLNNSKFVVKEDRLINTTISPTYTVDNKEQTVISAEIEVTFITEFGWNQNSLGYYYYPADQEPSSPANLEKFLIFPNVSVDGGVPFSKILPEGLDFIKTGNNSWDVNDYGLGNAPVSPNLKVKLLYKREDGTLTTNFPPNYTIGFFFIENGFSSDPKAAKGKVNTNNKFVYSNKAFNDDRAKGRYMALRTTNNQIVYGVEDGKDSSYEDILFCVNSTPTFAILDDEKVDKLPTVDVENEEEIEITVTDRCDYLFAYEDIWPSGGDFDLNDIIIRCNREILFNHKNEVLSIKESFTPIQRVGSASLPNAFAIQIPEGMRGSLSLPTGAVDEQSDIILIPSCNDGRNKEVKLERTFTSGQLYRDKISADIKKSMNPFIIANYEAGASERDEVHLPKGTPSPKANLKHICTGDDAYYIHKEGKKPFAIMLPGDVNFVPADEKSPIWVNYPKFINWVESNGQKDEDWYLYRKN